MAFGGAMASTARRAAHLCLLLLIVGTAAETSATVLTDATLKAAADLWCADQLGSKSTMAHLKHFTN